MTVSLKSIKQNMSGILITNVFGVNLPPPCAVMIAHIDARPVQGISTHHRIIRTLPQTSFRAVQQNATGPSHCVAFSLCNSRIIIGSGSICLGLRGPTSAHPAGTPQRHKVPERRALPQDTIIARPSARPDRDG